MKIGQEEKKTFDTTTLDWWEEANNAPPLYGSKMDQGSNQTAGCIQGEGETQRNVNISLRAISSEKGVTSQHSYQTAGCVGSDTQQDAAT